MGICASKEKMENKHHRANTYKEPGAKVPAFQGSSALIGSNTSFNPVRYDHVIANSGSVEKEYRLLTPPLGQGAFGEVRQAIHLSTGLKRAVKIIYKDKSDPVELEKIKDEVRGQYGCLI